MRHAAAFLSFLLLLPLLLLPGACSSGSDPDVGADAGPDDSCVPASCRVDQCGIQPDGCGGELDCGSCVECTPANCDAQDCGPTSDGCGKSMDCGACQSCEDDGVAGDSPGSAAHLGTYSDNSGTTGSVANLRLVAGEEDWFVLGVEDACCLGNPKPGIGVDASASAVDITVMMAYVCGNASEPGYECEGGVYDANLGACILTAPAGSSTSFMSLTSLNCSGGNEGGTAIIRVSAAGGECEDYVLNYEVTK